VFFERPVRASGVGDGRTSQQELARGTGFVNGTPDQIPQARLDLPLVKQPRTVAVENE
jgi:hypothetical protein